MHSQKSHCQKVAIILTRCFIALHTCTIDVMLQTCMKISSDLVAVRQSTIIISLSVDKSDTPSRDTPTYSENVPVCLRFTYFIRPLWLNATTSNIWRAQNHSGLTHQRVASRHHFTSFKTGL